MKFRLLTLTLLCCGAAATAQNPYIALEGAAESAAGIAVSMPRSVLAVDLSVECSTVLCGPYARYEAFAALQPDKTSATVYSLEDAARMAAEQIFSLRRHRLELITGEAGENVFGEGLNAALAEIERLEQSYLELFLGKQIVSTRTQRYLVYPSADRKQYVFCRFSPAAGLLPESDLSGDMVVLQIEPSGDTECPIEAGPKEQGTVKCRMADPSTCTVIASGREYARAVVPLFEFGRTVQVALPRRR